MKLIDNLLVGVGAMKAGTTWLVSHLKNHPDIFMGFEKEIGYFSYHHDPRASWVLEENNRIKKFYNYLNQNNKSSAQIRNYLLWGDNYLSEPIDDYWYRNQFIGRNSEKYCCDFSNLYAHLPDSGWDHIRSVSRNIKAIYIVREPLDRLWSHVKFQLDLDGLKEEANSWDVKKLIEYAEVDHIMKNSNYNKVIDSLDQNLEKEELLIINFNDIKLNPKQVLKDVESFLGIRHIEYGDNALNRKVNSSVSFPMPQEFKAYFEPILNTISDKLF